MPHHPIPCGLSTAGFDTSSMGLSVACANQFTREQSSCELLRTWCIRLPFLIPTYRHLMRGKSALSLALLMNDIIGFDRNRQVDAQKQLPRGRIISREACLRLFPGVEERGLTGGAIYYDCQMYNSERLILSRCAIRRHVRRRPGQLCRGRRAPL